MNLRLKRNTPFVFLLVTLTSGLWLGMGNQHIITYSSSAGLPPAVSQENTNNIALFDDQVVHSVQILMSPTDYQGMITMYQQTGQKDYFPADIILDGERINNVGVRVKGNSSLRTALGRSGNQGMFGENRNPQAAINPPQANPIPGQPPANPINPPGGGQLPREPGRQENPGARPIPQDRDIPPDSPQAQPQFRGENQTANPVSSAGKIPLMVKFDVFEPGQRYQGYSSFAIRTYGTATDAAMMQEPITYFVFKLAKLTAPKTAYAGVRINDEPERLFTISEVINATYLDQYFADSTGVLYKAEVGSELRYRGDDPSLYNRNFTQQTRMEDRDLAPLITFMRFLSESDDSTFEKELPSFLDIESFSSYLAINNLLVNLDSLAGMGNNYYLYYDETIAQFKLLVWDGNESLGKLGAGGQAANFDLYYQNQQGMRMPMRTSNILFTRFMANSTFRSLYEQKLKSIYRQSFESGAILDQIEFYASLIRQVNEQRNLVSSTDYERAVTNTISFITRRKTFLSATPLLAGLSSSTLGAAQAVQSR